MHPQISISAMSSDAPSWKERMAIALARDIIDGERIISGAHTEISFAAAMLAQKMHAPNVKLQLGGTCFLVNVVDLPVRLPKTSTDYRMLRWAEIAYDHMETFMYFGAPGGRAYYAGKRPPTNKYFVGDKFFAGGIQVDGDGNANMIGLRGEGGRRFAFRGPGSIGITDIVTVATPTFSSPITTGARSCPRSTTFPCPVQMAGALTTIPAMDRNGSSPRARSLPSTATAAHSFPAPSLARAWPGCERIPDSLSTSIPTSLKCPSRRWKNSKSYDRKSIPMACCAPPWFKRLEER